MPSVIEFGQATMQPTHSRFTWLRSPYFSHSDQPWHQGIATWNESDGILVDYDLQCIYPEPVRLLHDQAVFYDAGDDTGFGNVTWQNLGNIAPESRVNYPWNFFELLSRVSPNDANITDFHVGAEIEAQGVVFFWSRLEQNAAAELDDSDEGYTTFRVGVGTGADMALYSLSLSRLGNVHIARSLDGGATWTILQAVPVSSETWKIAFGDPDDFYIVGADSTVGSEPPTTQMVLDVRLLAGRIMFRLASNDACYVFDEARIDADNEPIWQINWIEILAHKYVSLSCSAHPLGWRAHSYMDSQEFNIGFYSERVDVPTLDPAGMLPPGWSANIDDANTYLFGPTCYYRLELEGPVDGTFRGVEYSNTCMPVRSVNFNWFADPVRSSVAPVTLPVQQIRVSHSFDPNTLQIASYGDLQLNNYNPRSLPDGSTRTWGEWLNENGQFCGDIQLTRTDATGTVLMDLQQVFAGYFNCDAPSIAMSPRGSTFTMPIGDRRRQLANPEFNLPWMDGWNFFYTIAFLAGLGQVALSDCGFAPYVPADRFGDNGSPEGEAYFLPQGQAGSVLTRWQRLPPWEIITRLCFSIGYLAFFDVNGILQIGKFRLAPGVKRSFYESDRDSAIYQPAGGLEGCRTLNVTKDLSQVRNISTLIGIRTFAPRYDPIVYKTVDVDSIEAQTSFNHLGYRMGAVWMDSQFGNEDYALFASTQMATFLRYPGISATIETWLQPDLFPLDMISVQSDRAGISGRRLLVTDVMHSVNQNEARTYITARHVPDIFE